MANSDNLAMLQQGAETWNQWRNSDSGVTADLIGADLSGADLTGAKLSGAELSGADLSAANLSGAKLNGADLSAANLSGADLRQADLRVATLGGADLSGAQLRGADLSGCKLSGCKLSRANLAGANLRVVNLSGADLSGADLGGANLSGANLSVTNLSGTNLNGADLSGADLSGADLRMANLSGADLRVANLSGANLSGANLQNAQLELAGLINANLDGINLTAASLWETKPTGWSIKGTIYKSMDGEPQAERIAPLHQDNSADPVLLPAECAGVRIFYKDGLSSLEIATLRALIKHLEELSPGSGLRLVRMGEAADGIVVELAIEDGGRSEEELDELQAALQAEAQRIVEYQRLALADRKTSLQLEGRVQELDSFVDKLILAAGPGTPHEGANNSNPGPASAAGPSPQLQEAAFRRIGSQIESSIDIGRLVEELAALRQAMSHEALEAEQYVAVGNVAKAEQAAKVRDSAKMAENLRAAGGWALEIASRVGATLAAKAIRHSIISDSRD
ncbi:MAG TPA: pentapeptide repeat-containing protein [Blastocatellia bacterium]|nr:pentapeptide repeat-containing protein [Blastocatellia bacterium]